MSDGQALQDKVLLLATLASRGLVDTVPGVVDLGQQSVYLGSRGQAGALLQHEPQVIEGELIVVYRTPEDGVAVGWSERGYGELCRIHVTTAGPGYCESWKRHARERLQAAAKGAGTFNDTPRGKQFGTRMEIGAPA